MSPEGKAYYSDDRRRAGEKFMNAEQEQSKEKNSLKNKLVMAKVAIGNAMRNAGNAVHNTMHAIGEKMTHQARYVKGRVSSWCDRRFNKKSESKEQSEATTDNKPEYKLPDDVEDFLQRFSRGEADIDEAKGIAKSMERANKAREAEQDTKSEVKPEAEKPKAESEEKKPEEKSEIGDTKDAKPNSADDGKATSTTGDRPNRFKVPDLKVPDLKLQPEDDIPHSASEFKAEAQPEPEADVKAESEKNEVDKTDRAAEVESSEEKKDTPLSPEERKAGMEQLRGAHEMIMTAVTTYDVTSASQVIEAYNQMVTGYASKGLDVDQLRLSSEDLQRIMYNAMIKEMSYARQNANHQQNFKPIANGAPDVWGNSGNGGGESATETPNNAEQSAQPEAGGNKPEAAKETQSGDLDPINKAIEAGNITEAQFNGLIDSYNRSLINRAMAGEKVADAMLTQEQISSMAERLRHNIERNQRADLTKQLRELGRAEVADPKNPQHEAYQRLDRMDSVFRNNTDEDGKLNEADALAELKEAGVELSDDDMKCFKEDAAQFVESTRKDMDSLLCAQGANKMDWSKVDPKLARWYMSGGNDREPRRAESGADNAADNTETQEFAVNHEAAYNELDQKMEREQAVFDSAFDSIDSFQQSINDWRFQQGVESGHAVSNEDMQQQFGDLYGLLDTRTDENGNQLPVRLTPEGQKMVFQMAAAEYDQSHDHAANGKHAAETEQAQSLDDLKQRVEAFNQFNAARQAKNEKPVSFYSYLVMNK